MRNRVNVALVGAGYWGQKLLPKFLAAPQALVRVVCDIHAENRAEIQRKFPEVATAESFAVVIADRQLDAVVIVTPLASHFHWQKRRWQLENMYGWKSHWRFNWRTAASWFS